MEMNPTTHTAAAVEYAGGWMPTIYGPDGPEQVGYVMHDEDEARDFARRVIAGEV